MSVVQARCPKCQNLLRIPADWVGRPLRCKHCQEVFQARSKGQEAPATAVAASVPTSRPLPGMAAAPTNGVNARGPSHVAAGNGDDPFAFSDDAAAAPAITPRPRQRARQGGKGWLKFALLAVCVLAVGAGVFIFAGPQLSKLFNADKDKNKLAAADKGKGTNGASDKKGGDNDDPPILPKKKGKKTDPKLIVRGGFPRRALLINVNHYLFANSLHYGSPREGKYPGSSTMALAD